MVGKLEYLEALDIVKCIDTLASFLGESFNEVGNRLVFSSDERREKINGAIELVNKWQDMSFEQRASAFGYKPEKTPEGNYTITTEL